MAVKTYLLATFVGFLAPSFGQIRQVVPSDEVGTALSITGQLVDELLRTPSVGLLDIIPYAPMFDITTDDAQLWASTTLDGTTFGFAQEVVNTYLEIPAASQKRSSDFWLTRRQASGAILEARLAISDNATASLTQARDLNRTVCDGKGASCALCFVSASMIYLGASTGCGLAAGVATGLSAGALTPEAIIGLASCLSGTTGALLAAVSNCGN